MVIVYLHRPHSERWCVLRSSHPGGLIATVCGDTLDYQPVNIATALTAARICTDCTDGEAIPEPIADKDSDHPRSQR